MLHSVTVTTSRDFIRDVKLSHGPQCYKCRYINAVVFAFMFNFRQKKNEAAFDCVGSIRVRGYAI